jgi:hypothetical protein
MQRISISLFALLVANLNIFGQIRTITGKVIGENFESIWGARIQNTENIILGTTDSNGQFKIDIPQDTKTLIFSWVGYERASINLTPGCTQLDIILLASWTYDYISLKKIDKLRMKQFKKLPELHLSAYQKGLFTTAQPCYEQVFIPYYKKGG